MADFIFRVDSVHLTDAQQQKIAAAIQGAVLTELAQLDLHAEPKSRTTAATAEGIPGDGFLYRPVNWKGGIMIGLDGIKAAVGNVLTVSVQANEQNRAA